MKAIAENSIVITGLLATMRNFKYPVNERPYEVNLLGVRNNNTIANTFDDRLYLFYKKSVNGGFIGCEYPITTDPGTYHLKRPMMVEGTAILKQGRWAYKLGYHQGYEALNQREPVVVIRDVDRNDVLGFKGGKEYSGFFGINIHRASKSGTTSSVDKWSAGCQVFADASDFADFMSRVKYSVSLYGNSSLYYHLVDNTTFSRTLMAEQYQRDRFMALKNR